MTKPILYLNKAEQNGEILIRLLYKPNKMISDIIQRNDWISYNQIAGSYCVTYTTQNMNLLKDLFSDSVSVNTYYLHAVPKVKADEIELNRDIRFSCVLPACTKTGSIFLVPQRDGDRGMILIKFKRNNNISKLLIIKSYITLSQKYCCYFFDAKLSVLRRFIHDFAGDLKIHVHHKLIINDISIKQQLLEQHYIKKDGFKSCPPSLLQSLVKGNYSMNTIETYHHMVLKFINTFKSCSMEQINNFSEKQVNDYHLALRQSKQYAIITINQSISAIKYYYSNVLQREFETKQIVRPKKNKTLPEFYTAEEIKKIINATTYLKHKAMIMLIYSSGLRISELLNLKPSDILPGTNQILIRGAKGRKDRYTILSEKALHTLREYFREIKPEEYLFEGQFGGRYSTSSFRNVLTKSLKKAGVQKKGSSHVLRHTFATHLLESGVDIRIIQELLGHASSKTTEIYTHVTNKYIQSIKSPLDNLKI